MNECMRSLIALKMYPYLAVVLNFSQSWALYCLVHFYAITKNELAHMKPLYKFLMFKSIVFLTWWQGVAIALLYAIGLFKSPMAQSLQFKSRRMGIAFVVHLYVFPAKPYEMMGDRISGNVAVLGDYGSVDCPLDPDEVRDSERPTKLRLPQPEARSGMTIRESVKDVFLGGGEYLSSFLDNKLGKYFYFHSVMPSTGTLDSKIFNGNGNENMIVNDVKFTVTQAVNPVENGITKFN
ncbi:hypothetical protein ACS0TY_013271 [Phlomoides rotata]